MANDRYLQGYIRMCGDECCCAQPVIEEVEYGRYRDTMGMDSADRRTTIWEGTFLCGPLAPAEQDALREELEEAARRHHLEEDRPGGGLWERAI